MPSRCSKAESREALGLRTLKATPKDLPFVWEVSSGTRGHIVHQVDLSHYAGNGECSCEHFCCDLAKLLRAEADPVNRHRCVHIQTARDAFLDALLGGVEGAAPATETGRDILTDFVLAELMESARIAVGGLKVVPGVADWPLMPGFNC